jgi:hypothetical protein
MTAAKPSGIEVRVTFAAAERPYTHEFEADTLIGTVLDAALAAFEITTDGTTRYYLLHDGTEVPTTDTVGQVAGHAHELHLPLRTETIQGTR